MKKACSQCHKKCPVEGFAKKQWKKPNPSCRLCAEFTNISQDTSRTCHECHLDLPRMQYDIYQWGKGNKALCHSCRDAVGQKMLDSIDEVKATTELPDGTIVCRHSLECCDVCMMDFTLPNQFARKRNEFGRDLKEEEYNQVTQEWKSQNDVHISRKICILDGRAVCPRSSKKLRCPCNEVTYCSKACQKHHWMIHKMTCKVHAKNQEKNKAKKKKQASARTANANDLTEEQKSGARIEAFLAENNGGEHSIEECAWQLGEHPFVIGGGSIRYGRNGEEFVKGDVAQIYREKMGVEWDGSARFGMGPYEQRKTRVDWIAKARQGKSQHMKDLESEMMAMGFDN